MKMQIASSGCQKKFTRTQCSKIQKGKTGLGETGLHEYALGFSSKTGPRVTASPERKDRGEEKGKVQMRCEVGLCW